jgi:hypothetical protein
MAGTWYLCAKVKPEYPDRQQSNNMKKILYLLITLAVVSCGPSEDPAPENLISQEKMIQLLIDMHLAEGKAFAMDVGQDSSKVLSAILGAEALQKHNTTEQVFLESYNYYLTREQEMYTIYQAVLDSLNFREKIQNFN